MLPFISPTTFATNYGGTFIRLNMPDVNHNTGNKEKAYEIVNNILSNPIGIRNKQLQEWIMDIQLVPI